MPKSSHITPVPKSLHWLKNKRTHQILTPFSNIVSPNKLTSIISTTWFLFNLVTTHVLHLWSLLLVHLPTPLLRSLLALFGMLHLVYGMNCPLIFVSLVRESPALSPIDHTWQFIIVTIFTITTCIFSYSFSLSFWTQDLALRQIISFIDLFLSYWNDSTDSRII